MLVLDTRDLPDDVYTYQVNPYWTWVLYTFDWDAFQATRKWFGVEEYKGPLVNGMVSQLEKDNVRTLVMYVNPEDINTVVHECGHVVLFVMEEIGHNIFDGHEPFCYSMEHIFNEVNNARLMWVENNGPAKN